MTLALLMTLLPVVFMLHDFEELILFRPWLAKHRAEIRERFPAVDRLLARTHDGLSQSALTVAVLHEFALIAAVTYLALALDLPGLWFGACFAFAAHLLVHIGQWVIFGRYVPVIITSWLALPYCAYALSTFLATTTLPPGQLALWALLGLALTALSFPSAFALAARFERWLIQRYL